MPFRIHSTRICTCARFLRTDGAGACAAGSRGWERKSIPEKENESVNAKIRWLVGTAQLSYSSKREAEGAKHSRKGRKRNKKLTCPGRGGPAVAVGAAELTVVEGGAV
jgi:hypothetical protein